MIYDVLHFLKQRLDGFLSEGRAGSEPLIALANPWSGNDSNKSASFLNSISLIQVEEERVFKSQLPKVVQRPNGQHVVREPDIKLNLYVLMSAYHKNYEDGLKLLSRIVRFFQVNQVFEDNDLPAGVGKLVVELHTAGFEQQNQIWASLSTGYIPSVIYKVRMIIIDDGPDRPVSLIREVKTDISPIGPN
ncbi:MAG TPA: DUF4255 domain-containing protein [Puia sp.]|jgi:hypothetical protein|nr:DUF4255 domain-containing protein [Puia sp.]